MKLNMIISFDVGDSTLLMFENTRILLHHCILVSIYNIDGKEFYISIGSIRYWEYCTTYAAVIKFFNKYNLDREEDSQLRFRKKSLLRKF